jgi:hypothetical protein
MIRTAFVRVVLLASMLLTAAPAWAGDGQSLLKYLPANSKLVLNVNVAALRPTQTYQIAANTLRNTNTFQNAQTKLGNLDPNLIDTILISNIDQNPDDPQLLVVLEGRFNKAQIEAECAKRTEVTKETFENVPMWVAGPREAAGFAADNIIVIGSKEAVAAAIKGAPTAPADAIGRFGALSAHLRAVDKTQEVWFATSVSQRTAARNPQVAGYKAIRGAIDIGAGMSLNAVATMDSADTAARRATEISANVSASAAAPELRAFGLQPVFQSTRAAATGADITITSGPYDQGVWTQMVRTFSAVLAEEIR